jgi:hypothetical protein
VIIAKVSNRLKHPKVDWDCAKSIRRNAEKPARLTFGRIAKKTILVSKNKKALSPIFASLIILAVVTVLFIPVFIWSTNMTSQTQDSWNLSGQIATERIVLEEANLKAGQTNSTIYIRNIGSTAVSVSDILISSSNDNIHTYVGSQLVVDLDSAVQGDLITVTIGNLGFTPSTGETYTLKAYTTKGVGDAYQVVT